MDIKRQISLAQTYKEVMNNVLKISINEQEIFEAALKNRASFDAVKKEAYLAQKLFAASKILNLSLDVEDSFNEFSENISESIDYDAVGLAIIEEGQKKYKVYRSNVKTKKDAQDNQGTKRPLKGTSIEYILENKTMQIIEDFSLQKRFLDDKRLYEQGFNSGVRIPLVYDNRVEGVIAFYNEKKRQYSKEDILILNFVADQTAAYLHNAKLYMLSKERKESHKVMKNKLLAINALTEILGEQRSVRSLLPSVLKKILEIMAFEIGSIYLINDKQLNLKLETSIGLSQEAFDSIETINYGEHLVGRAAAQGKTIVIEENFDSSLKSDFFIAEKLKCAVYLPLLAKKKVVGVMTIASKVISEITPNQVEIFESLSNYFAMAILRLRMMETLAKHATLDPLTGLYNRRAFFEDLESYISLINRHGGKAAILMMDVDHFKKYNDTKGHLSGDKMLRRVASSIKDSIRMGDVAARFGGEEFVVLATGADIQDAIALAERIRFGISKKNDKENVTISIGIASYPLHGKDENILLKYADEALYKAKENGRNRVEIYQNVYSET